MGKSRGRGAKHAEEPRIPLEELRSIAEEIGRSKASRRETRRVYVDLCVLKRPFDDQSQSRVWLETQAIGLILEAIRAGQVEFVSSSALEFENAQNPWPMRREATARWLDLAAAAQRLTGEVEKRAGAL